MSFSISKSNFIPSHIFHLIRKLELRQKVWLSVTLEEPNDTITPLPVVAPPKI